MRSAAAGASTCYYHGPAAGQVKRVAARGVADAESKGVARKSGRAAFTTRELSKRTCEDFETLFAEGTGWGRCGCLFALDAPRSTRGGTWAEQREVNLCTMRGLVEQGRSYREGDVLFKGGSAKVRFDVEVEGVGPVAALYRSKRSMHGAPLGGTVDLFRREGFGAVAVLPRPTSRRARFMPDRIVMRRMV